MAAKGSDELSDHLGDDQDGRWRMNMHSGGPPQQPGAREAADGGAPRWLPGGQGVCRGTHGAQDTVKRRQRAINDVSPGAGVTSAPTRLPQVTGETAEVPLQRLMVRRTTGRRRGRAVPSPATKAALRPGTGHSAEAGRQARSTPRREPRRRQRWSTLRHQPAGPATSPTAH